MDIAGIRPKGLTRAHVVEAGIAEEYWECDFDTYQGTEYAKSEVVGYLENLKEYKSKGVGLLLAGSTGTGKTTLLAIVLKYLRRANWSCYMTSISELIELIKRSWEDKALVNTIDYYKHIDFLGLDDLGKEFQGPTGFSSVTFDNLLRFRVQHRLPTLFTTNLNSGEIKERYGEATLSLIEGKTKIVLVGGPDYRRSILKHELA